MRGSRLKSRGRLAGEATANGYIEFMQIVAIDIQLGQHWRPTVSRLYSPTPRQQLAQKRARIAQAELRAKVELLAQPARNVDERNRVSRAERELLSHLQESPDVSHSLLGEIRLDGSIRAGRRRALVDWDRCGPIGIAGRRQSKEPASGREEARRHPCAIPKRATQDAFYATDLEDARFSARVLLGRPCRRAGRPSLHEQQCAEPQCRLDPAR